MMPVYENEGNYLLVKIHEPCSLKLILTTNNEIAAHCKKVKLDRVAVDLREVEGNPGTVDRYEMGTEVARVLGAKIQTAAVAQISQINWMAETVAVNRGARFKVFVEMETR